ncbi:hypothetical protein ACQ2H7_000520 [Candidozyma auris]
MGLSYKFVLGVWGSAELDMGCGSEMGDPGLSLNPRVDLIEWALKLEKNDMVDELFDLDSLCEE